MRKIAILVAGGFAALCGLLALGGTASAEIKLKFGHILDTNSAVHAGAVAAAEKMAACTNGEVTIEIFPGGQLGNESALNNAVRVGGVDLVNTGSFFLSNEVPIIGVSTLPYIFRDRDHALAYIKSDTLRGVMDKWEEATGQHLLAASYASAFHIMSNKAYPKPEDMAGQRIRTPDAPAWTVFPTAVGAVPTPIALGEVYLALQQGVVDGSTMPLPVFASQKFYEVTKFYNLTYHSYEITFMIAGEHVRGQLNDAQWACLGEAGATYAKTHQDRNLESENSLRADMTEKKLVEFVDVDLSAYQAATSKVIDEKIAAGVVPAELVEQIRALK